MLRFVYLSIPLLVAFGVELQLEGHLASPDIEFVILIPSYNNAQFARKNLESVGRLVSSKPYRVIIVNDCSTDGTDQILDEYVVEHNLQSKVTILHNAKRVGSLANIYNTIHAYIPDHKIVVMIDGDDNLAHKGVLLSLENAYKNSNCWMTYGSGFIIDYNERVSEEIPEWVLQRKLMRQYKWASSHLKTFKAGLFKKIKKEDLMYQGEFYPTTGDLAFMLPMLEMCAPKDSESPNHSRFIDEILYLYRADNPLSDFRAHTQKVLFFANEIRNKPQYEQLDHL